MENSFSYLEQIYKKLFFLIFFFFFLNIIYSYLFM